MDIEKEIIDHHKMTGNYIISRAKTEEERDHELALAKAQRPSSWARSAATIAECMVFIVFWVCLFQHCAGGKTLPW